MLTSGACNGNMLGKVCVIILNWNGWQDTIACLQSLLVSSIRPERIIVCDNGSSDGSADHILSWAAQQSGIELVDRTSGNTSLATGNRIFFTLLRNESNLGYSAGNNKGLQLALSENCFEFVWLLNNDTSH